MNKSPQLDQFDSQPVKPLIKNHEEYKQKLHDSIFQPKRKLQKNMVVPEDFYAAFGDIFPNSQPVKKARLDTTSNTSKHNSKQKLLSPTDRVIKKNTANKKSLTPIKSPQPKDKNSPHKSKINVVKQTLDEDDNGFVALKNNTIINLSYNNTDDIDFMTEELYNIVPSTHETETQDAELAANANKLHKSEINTSLNMANGFPKKKNIFLASPLKNRFDEDNDSVKSSISSPKCRSIDKSSERVKNNSIKDGDINLDNFLGNLNDELIKYYDYIKQKPKKKSSYSKSVSSNETNHITRTTNRHNLSSDSPTFHVIDGSVDCYKHVNMYEVDLSAFETKQANDSELYSKLSKNAQLSVINIQNHKFNSVSINSENHSTHDSADQFFEFKLDDSTNDNLDVNCINESLDITDTNNTYDLSTKSLNQSFDDDGDMSNHEMNSTHDTISSLDQSTANYYTNEDSDTTNNFELVTIDEQRVLLIIDLNSKVYCYGFMRMQLLKGAASVFGYYLHPFQSIEFYSPRGSSLLYIESLEKCNDEKATEIQSNMDLPYNILQQLSKVPPHSTCILCEKMTLPKINFLEKYTAQDIFPKVNASVDCIFQSSFENMNVLKIHGHWSTIVKQVKEDTKLLICGGKSVGKSYLLRFLINKLLFNHRKVLVIDLDPGQPEFTIPGCVSSTIIDAPVFGPNYTHLREPSRCIFVPEVNLSNCYITYLKAVENLILASKDLMNIPTLINFMGYTRGMGFDILSCAISITKPTIIVEIKGTAPNQNYKQNIEHASIISTASRLSSQSGSLPFFLHIPTSSWGQQFKSWHLEPRQIREMLVLCYFGQILKNCDNSLCHKNVPVYQMDLTKIKLLHNNKVISPAVVNANLVALCTSYQNTFICHGWGIVRAIDLEKNVCYLISPISLEKLENVDYFIMGSVNLPPSMYMTAQHCSDLIPYVAKGILKEFGAIPKRSQFSRRSMN